MANSTKLALADRARTSLVPLALGCGLALIAATVGGRAVAQRSPATVGALLEATHLPPLLTLVGEQTRLTYDVHCALRGVEDPELACPVRGVVFLRSRPNAPFLPLPLVPTTSDGIRQLTAIVPASASASGFEYYAELESRPTDERLTVPPAGAAAPHRSLPLENPIEVRLGAHGFGSTTRGVRVAAARWGNGPLDVGLEGGRNLLPVGASAFDVGRDGSILILDQARRRILRWNPNAARAIPIPVSIQGRLADMVVDENDSIYVLESVSTPGRAPLVRRFDGSGRELDTVETAERSPSQIRLGPDGPIVLQHPSHQWMPVTVDGMPASPREQLRRGRTGRPLRSGGEIVVLRRSGEILAAVVSAGRVRRSWHVTSASALAEVQLAEPLSRGDLVIVARVYDDRLDEFVVLVLDEDGLARRLSLASADWAESAPVGRFRLGGDSLYRLGSSSNGAFVDRFDVGVR